MHHAFISHKRLLHLIFFTSTTDLHQYGPSAPIQTSLASGSLLQYSRVSNWGPREDILNVFVLKCTNAIATVTDVVQVPFRGCHVAPVGALMLLRLLTVPELYIADSYIDCIGAAFTSYGRGHTRIFPMLQPFFKFGKLLHGDLFFLIQDLNDSFDFFNLHFSSSCG